MDRSAHLPTHAEVPRFVYPAEETSGGGAIGSVGIIPQRHLRPQRLGGRPLEEHLALDGCPLFNKTTAPNFIAILFGMLSEEVKQWQLPPADAWGKARVGTDLGGTGKSAEKRREKRKAAKAAAAQVRHSPRPIPAPNPLVARDCKP